MTDMDLISDLVPDVDLPGPAELEPARSLLASAIEQERSRAGGPGGAQPARLAGPRRPGRGLRSPHPGRRVVLAAVAAGAVAAGVAAALVVVPGHGRPAGTAPAASGPAAHPVVPVRPFTGRLTAARFLNAAARAALTQPATPPRPDQFVYAESAGPGGSSKYQIWQSADASKAGLVVNGTGPIPLPACSGGPDRCFNAGYRPDLPTKPGAILPYLIRAGLAGPADKPGGQGLRKPIRNWVANDLGKEIDSLLSDTYLLPAQRAALFRYMARTPGYFVVRHAADAIGRPGIGIAWRYQGSETMIIFDRRNYAYLGDRTDAGGASYQGAALVRLKIVDSVPTALAASARAHAPKAKSTLATSPAPEDSGPVG